MNEAQERLRAIALTAFGLNGLFLAAAEELAEHSINEISQLLPQSADLQILGPTPSPIEPLHDGLTDK